MRILNGVTRIVIVLNKIVIKIPNFRNYKNFLNGILANLQEKEFSNIHDDLAKVKYCNCLGLFLIMEKVEAVDPKNIEYKEFKGRIVEKYKNDPLSEFMLSDCKPENWGYKENKLVKLDYGD